MDKFWERYIQSRPAPGESKGAFDAFAAAHRDPGPRTMAQEPRNMAQGGQLVQPGVGRQGYNGQPVKPGTGSPIQLGENPKFTRKRVKPGVGGETGYEYFINDKKVSRASWSKYQNVDYVKLSTTETLTKKFPRLEERAIELLNKGYLINDVNTALDTEGIIKIKKVED